MAVFVVTGGAGFIGSHIVTRLVERGGRVRVFDNYSSGKPENLAHVASDIEIIEGDLRDPVAVRRAIHGAEVIFHQAAVASVAQSIADPKTTFDVNVTGTLSLLLAARDAGTRRLVFASSSAVYGDSAEIPKVETMTLTPCSPYAVSKLTGEQLCSVFTRVYGLETVSLRYFNVFGPRQDPESQYAAVIPRFIRALREEATPVIYGDGEQTRDFVYVANVVDANLRAATADGVAGQVFNIAAGSAISINEMLRTVARLLGVTPDAMHDEPRPGDIRHSLADITAAREALRYEVSVRFDQGLEATVMGYPAH